MGLEPTTFAMPWQRSSQLSYGPVVEKILTEYKEGIQRGLAVNGKWIMVNGKLHFFAISINYLLLTIN